MFRSKGRAGEVTGCDDCLRDRPGGPNPAYSPRSGSADGTDSRRRIDRLTSPLRMIRETLLRAGRASDAGEQRHCGVERRANSRPPAISTTFPRYMTATRSEM
jgi:hypothetical protein